MTLACMHVKLCDSNYDWWWWWQDETLTGLYWTVRVVNIIILKVIFGLGKLASASASASWFWPRPSPQPQMFVLGLGDLSSASRICPHLTSLITGSNPTPNISDIVSTKETKRPKQLSHFRLKMKHITRWRTIKNYRTQYKHKNNILDTTTMLRTVSVKNICRGRGIYWLHMTKSSK